jgi:hypothetical protein
MLVEKLAVTYLRLQRCARAEAEYQKATWTQRFGFYDQPVYSLNEGSTFTPRHFEDIVNLISRYDTSLTNQLLRLLHELERLQRMRRREAVPPPVIADVNLNGDTST